MKELTDLKICRMIAEVEGLTIEGDNKTSVKVEQWWESLGIPAIVMYNPLSDWLILGPLMIKYRVDINHTNRFVCINHLRMNNFTQFKSDQEIPRAICLCILKSEVLL